MTSSIQKDIITAANTQILFQRGALIKTGDSKKGTTFQILISVSKINKFSLYS